MVRMWNDGGACNLSRVSDGLIFGMRIKQFQIPLWNLKREQHDSLHASAWYPICPIRPIPETALPPGSGPVVPVPTVSSHVEFTSAYCLYSTG